MTAQKLGKPSLRDERRLDASVWRDEADAHPAILAVVAAPEDSGDSWDALPERLVWDDMKGTRPPYVIEIHGTRRIAPHLAAYLGELCAGIIRARREHRARRGTDVEVAVELMD